MDCCWGPKMRVYYPSLIWQGGTLRPMASSAPATLSLTATLIEWRCQKINQDPYSNREQHSQNKEQTFSFDDLKPYQKREATVVGRPSETHLDYCKSKGMLQWDWAQIALKM